MRYLHSTMFIFISVRSECSWVNFKIYIPLCLYLYWFSLFFLLLLPFHLHSTMFIFIFRACHVIKFPTMIYIPLCLYLYIYVLCGRKTFTRIYIPLCLYLYVGHALEKCFTNNLHSTMFIFICICPLNSSKNNTFTFHYVYIYILPAVLVRNPA